MRFGLVDFGNIGQKEQEHKAWGEYFWGKVGLIENKHGCCIVS